MVLVVVIGVLIIFLGMVVLTDRVDRHWRSRGRLAPQPRISHRSMSPPFRYAASQCVDCGKDGDLLSIDTGQCLVCFELAHV